MKTGYDKFFINAKNNSRGGVKLNFPQNSQIDSESAQMSKSINVEQLKKSIKMSQKKKQSKKRKFPVVQFSMFIACLGLMFFLVEKYEDIEKFIGKIEVGLNSANAEAAASAAAKEIPVKIKEESKESEQKPVASMKLDDGDYLFKMADRKKELDEREEELNKKSEEIAKQKIEIEEKLKQLEEYRAQITNMLKERVATDASKVETLVQVYSNMKASQAAQIFENLDEDLVVEILGKMKKKSAADILNLVKAEKAKILSEKYAGYRAPAAQTTTTNEVETNNSNTGGK